MNIGLDIIHKLSIIRYIVVASFTGVNTGNLHKISKFRLPSGNVYFQGRQSLWAPVIKWETTLYFYTIYI